MSAGFVLDASVGFSWLYKEQASDQTEKLLENLAEGAVAVVPMLWFWEMSNILAIAQRKRRLTVSQRQTAIETIEQLALTVDEEGHLTALHRTIELAAEHGLTAYDASYLELAIRRKLSLATRDEALKEAARKCGVNTL